MTPKQYLQQVQQLKELIDRTNDDILRIRSLAESAGAIRYDKLNVQTSPDGDKMAGYMARLEKAETRALRLSEQYFSKCEVIRLQIDMISPQIYSSVLYLRYMKNYRLWEIALEKGYSTQYIKMIHGRALQEFGRVFPEIYTL